MSMKERKCSQCVDGWAFVAPSYALQFPEIHRGGAQNTVAPCQLCNEGRERAFSLNYEHGSEKLEYRQRELMRKAREGKV